MENLKTPSWKQAMAIAFKVLDAEKDSAEWTPAFKAKCRAEGLDPDGIGGVEDPRPLYARAIDAAAEMRKRQRRAS